MEFVPIEELRTQLEVNVIGPIAVTQAFLPLLRIARGRIVNMSSVSGVVAFPFMGPYAASKHALEALSDSMRVELAPWEIQVSVIEPASVFTPIWEKGLKNAQGIWDRAPEEAKRLYGARLTKLQDRAAKMGREGDSPQVVADAVEHALCARRPRTRYPVARGARAASILAKVVPDRLRDKLFSRELS
jgi:NAD(P)-dependent dehydrogenase (short-subunit alcohol dehydrogenase family)